MDITLVSVPAPGRTNEDHIAAGPGWAFVLDGATPRAGVESGCRHGVGWLVANLGGLLALALSTGRYGSLPAMVSGAISAVVDLHRDECDVTNPDSPSTTVAIMRLDGGTLEYLVLGDSPLLLAGPNGLEVIADERSANLPSYTAESVRAHRNQPHGFWIASNRPEAAHHAVTGVRPVSGIHTAALVTDGVTRFVERLGLGDWPDLMCGLDKRGPGEVIRQVRAAERAQLAEVSAEPNGRIVKRHDDASVALARFATE